MPATEAAIGYGSVFEMADEATPSTFVAMGEVYAIDPGSDETDEVEATHMQSPDRTREYIPGLVTPGEMSIEMNYIPGSAADLALLGASGKRNVGRITLPNGVRKSFPITLRSYQTGIPLDDRMTATATFRKAGATTTDTADAPVNGILPSIAGIAEQDEILTAVPGIWAPFATFTYQWKRDGTNIAGATAQTYTLVAGDVGKAITVAVTATNTAGSASATSAPTVNVVS